MSGTKIDTAVLEIKTDLGGFNAGVDAASKKALGMGDVFKQIAGIFQTAGKNAETSGQYIKMVADNATKFAPLQAAIKGFGDEMNNAKSATGGWIPIMKDLGDSWVARIAEGILLRDAIRGVIGGIRDAAMALPEIALKGAGVADVEENFKRLTSQAGQLGDTLLGTLKTGTHNTITDFELMKTVNSDLSAGMNLTDKQFGTLSKGAFALAQATGVDVKTALDTMNDAMLTGRTRALAMLTGKIDLTKAEEDYARSLGTDVEHLSEAGKLEAARIGILNSVADATERIGDQTDGLDERLAQLQTAWGNFQNDLGKTIATSRVLEAAMNGIEQAIKDAFGDSQQAAVKAVALAVDDALIKIVDLSVTGVRGLGLIAKEGIAVYKVFGDLAQIVDGAAVSMELMSLRAAKAMRAVSFGPAASARTEDIKRISENLNSLYDAMDKRGASLRNADASQVAIDASTEKFAGILTDLKAKMEAARSSTSSASTETAGLATATGDAAAAAKNHADMLTKSKEEISKAKAAAEEMRKALADLASAGTSWQDTVQGLDQGVADQVIEYRKAGVEMATLAKVYGLTATQSKALEERFKFLDTVSSATSKTFGDLNGQVLPNLNARFGNLHSMLTGVDDKTGLLATRDIPEATGALEDFGKATDEDVQKGRDFLQSISDMGVKTKSQLQIMADVAHAQFLRMQKDGTDVWTAQEIEDARQRWLAANKKAVGDTNTAFDTLGAAFGDLATDMTQLAQLSGDTFGGIARGIGVAAQAGEEFSKSLKSLSGLTLFNKDENGKNTSINFAALASSALSIVGLITTVYSLADAYNKAQKAKKELEEHQEGMEQLRADFKATTLFSESLATSLAATAKRIVAISPEVAKALGAIGDGVDQIAKASEIAEAMNLPDIIKELGGVSQLTAPQLDKVRVEMEDLVKAAQVGGSIGTDAISALDDTLMEFGDSAVKSGGLVSQMFLDTVKEAKAAGIELDKVNQFIVGQLKESATGLDRLIAGLQKAAVAKVTVPLVAGGMSQEDAEKKAADMGTVFKVTQTEANGLGAAIAGSFGEMIARGESFKDALAAIQDPLNNLMNALHGTGMNGGAAFANLVSMSNLANDAISGPLVDAIQGANQAIKGLHNSGILTEDEFDGLTASAVDAYNQIIAQGKDGNAALAIMQPTLQTIWEEQQHFGRTVDDATQALLNQAEASGTVGEQFESAQDRMADSMDRVAVATEGLARVFGVDLPDAADKGASGVNTALGRITPPDLSQTKKALDTDVPNAAAAGTKKIQDGLNGIQSPQAALDLISQALKDGLPDDAAVGTAKIQTYIDSLNLPDDVKADFETWFNEELPGTADTSAKTIQGSIDGLHSPEELKAALAKLFGTDLPGEADKGAKGVEDALSKIKVPTITIPINWDVPGGGAMMHDYIPPGEHPWDDWAGAQAAGGNYTVSRPTLFLAGEAGTEDVAFSGANRSFGGDSTERLLQTISVRLERLEDIDQAVRSQRTTVIQTDGRETARAYHRTLDNGGDLLTQARELMGRQ